MEGTRLGSIARGLALFLGLFSLLNILGELRTPGFDANLWWIDFAPLSQLVGRLVLALCAVGMLVYVLVPAVSRRLVFFCLPVTLLLLAVVIRNGIAYWRLLGSGELAGGIRIPFSFVIAMALILIAAAQIVRCRAQTGMRGLALPVATFVLSVVVFPLAQIVCFGNTDYRRPADVAVVFGAHVAADGTPSDIVSRRVLKAVELYKAGFCRLIIMSGGPGDGAIHETQAMRDVAVKAGVRSEDVLVDLEGLNTAATARNTAAMFPQHDIRRVLAVSDFYHLPRIKMTYRRAGWEVYTVPVRDGLRHNVANICREVAALLVYYLRPLVPSDL